MFVCVHILCMYIVHHRITHQEEVSNQGGHSIQFSQQSARNSNAQRCYVARVGLAPLAIPLLKQLHVREYPILGYRLQDTRGALQTGHSGRHSAGKNAGVYKRRPEAHSRDENCVVK